MDLESYDDTNGEFILYSTFTGVKLFYGNVKSRKLRSEIRAAVRDAEAVTTRHVRFKLIQMLEGSE